MFLDCWKILDLFKEMLFKTPRVKLSGTESNAIENSSILEGEQATFGVEPGDVRTWQDRADISEAIKCLARGMSKPRTIQLKRVARNLTRRSTTGVIVRRGQHLRRHSSTVQNVIGLSSAESEYYAHTKGGCSGLGLQSLFADWNLKLQVALHTDSSSAKAIASRRGTGKSTRHIQTRMPWLQERVAAKHLRVVKVASESNPADMLTKVLGRSNIEEFCAEIGQTAMRRNIGQGIQRSQEKPRKSSLRLKQLKWMIKNRFKDARIARAKNKLKDARIAKIKNESKVEKIQWMLLWIDFSKIAETVGSVEDGQLWNRKGSLNPWTQSWIEIAARVKD